MPLYTASFYDPQDWVGQPFRISRGHPRGRKVQWGTLPFFFPERALVRAYRGGEIDFTDYTPIYLDHLDRTYETSDAMGRWIHEDMPKLEDFTLLCFERFDAPCHRRLLAGWLAGKCPDLQIGWAR